ncbi:MAG: right-handed parallel beta-helix repeat-containing protein [Bacteroidales bacterium]|nr:right-handed parallel beta-helix repeat-containing protein [Bacteroidales bacterium]MBR3540721.1 right-handed parallel beta-helix repeat-containing protein [Bacteroidales bacterium]
MKAKSVLLSMVMALSGSICLAEPVHIYASPDGLSPHEALREAREMRRLHKVGTSDTLYIHLAEGTYYLGETLFVRPEDSGTPSSPTVIIGAENGKSVLSGGVPLKMKGDDDDQPEYYYSYSLIRKNPIFVRQLWKGDEKVPHSSLVPLDSMINIIDFRKDEREVWIPLATFQPFLKGDVVAELRNLEMILHQRWAMAILRVKDYAIEGDIVKLSFEEPESRLEFEHPWPQPVVNEDRGDGVLRTSSFNLLGGLCFLKPGTWFHDNGSGVLMYRPTEIEQNLSNSSFTAPVLQTLVEVSGSLERPVHDIIFRNVSFQHAAWNRPSFKGHVTLQGGMYLLDAYKLQIPGLPEKEYLENQAWIERPEAAVTVRGGQRINFEGCEFTHLGATGLDYVWADSACVVKSCHFHDIGGTALALGAFPDRGFETHVPFRPVNMRELCSDFLIADNLIEDVTNEDWGCVGIGAGYVADCIIEHNIVRDVNYSGICIGWGWTPLDSGMKNNHIRGNKVYRFAKMLYDAGGIYTLSYMPGSTIEDNIIDEIYPPKYATNLRGFYIYLDEATDGVTIRNNWCPEERFGDNRPGPDVHWINNGPKATPNTDWLKSK